MNETEAIELASNFARKEGYDTVQYDIKVTKRDLEWEIYFQRKSEQHKPRPGDFFTVYVDDKSASVQRIIHGK